MRALGTSNCNGITKQQRSTVDMHGHHYHRDHPHDGIGGGNGIGMVEEVAGAQDTIYLCNFRVSVDGEWLCLKELQDLEIKEGGSNGSNDDSSGTVANFGIANDDDDKNKCQKEKNDREWVKYYSRDPAAIERSNLVNICKLVVKELLEQSLRFGRMLDSDHLPLQHFFIVLEHVLRHGLKPKKGLLGPKKELWDILQSVEKYCYEAQDITSSVRDLPTVRTHMGRARAWLRIALMQKKLADYLQALMENKDEALSEYYEPHALMMSEEVVVIMGILVGLNVIDCNLCVKEEDLDSQQGVIDFSLYLRSSTRPAPEDDNNIQNTESAGNMTTVLDQKNYIEELNRHLNATVSNLQTKVESLTTTNALMKEDLAIARNSLLALQAENSAMRNNLQNHNTNNNNNNGNNNHNNTNNSNNNNSDTSLMNYRNDPELVESLSEEIRIRKELDKELELQISLKAEKEMAMKLLEKNIHEKQDTIISLRQQLQDIKLINMDLYKKLQECEASLNHKTELLTKLESQKEAMANAINQLEKKYASESSSLTALQETSQALSLQVVACEERAARSETDLRIEREWRNELQEKEVKHREQINSLQYTIKQLNNEAKKHDKVKSELDRVRKEWSEAQTTLEELGIQLSVSKLQVSELQEKAMHAKDNNGNNYGSNRSINSNNNMNNSSQQDGGGGGGIWTPDSTSSNCKGCNREFSMTRRKHHCRNCGQIFCNNCSEHVAPLPNDNGQNGKPVRVCDGCWEIINAPRN